MVGSGGEGAVYWSRWCGGLVCVVFCLGLLVPGSASASFTRPFLREILSAGASPLSPGGIAVDGENDLWVENSENSLVEFAPAYAPGDSKPVESLPVEGGDRLEQLAVADAAKDFYIAGNSRRNGPGSVEIYDRAGEKQREWGSLIHTTIAIDNSSSAMEDPSACETPPLSFGECFVYVTIEGESGGIVKDDSQGKEVPFAFDQECEETHCGYVSKGEITGIPGQPTRVFGGAGLRGVAVDAKGDIFAVNSEADDVYEYLPSGKFLQTFNLGGNEVPLFEGHLGLPTSVAVDPVSKHLIIPVVTENANKKVGGIDEFNIETGRFVAQITETTAGGRLVDPAGVAVDSYGDVYVVDRGSGAQEVVDVYGPGVFLPTLALGVAGERKAGSAVLSGSVNPEGLKLTECKFQYVSEEVYEKEGFTSPSTAECVPHASEIAADDQTHEVEGEVSGLTAGVTYRYRLLAHSEGALGGSAATSPLAFTTPAAPEVVSASAGNVSSTFADLHALINPHGAATSYFFEYGPTVAYGSDAPVLTEAAPEGAGIGSGGPTGGGVESVVQHVGGLLAGSEYHFRVVAVNECETGKNCVAYSGDETFMTLPGSASGLPDHRGYELVTPANKEGGSDMFTEPETNHEYYNESDLKSVGTPSLSGNGFLLETFSSFGPFPSAGTSDYVFQREPAKGEWTYTSLAAPALGTQTIYGSDGLVFEPMDLSRVGFTDTLGSERGQEGAQYRDLVGAPGGPYATLREDPPFHENEKRSETLLVGASHDLNHIILESNNNSVCPGAANAAGKVKAGDVLCEWDGGYEPLEGGGVRPELRFVNLAPGSETEPASTCGATLGAHGPGHGEAHGAVSAEGTIVLFTAPQGLGRERFLTTGPGCWNETLEEETGKAEHPPQLYARVQETSALGEPVFRIFRVSAPEAGVKEGAGVPREYPAVYAGASEDGSKIFFVSRAWLTADHPEGHDRELYECEITVGEHPGCKLTRVSVGAPGSEAAKAGAEVDWVPAVSADGAAVYFTAFDVLADGATREPAAANSADGHVNVYRYDTETATTGYVATVNTEDYSDQPGTCVDTVTVTIGPCAKVDWYTTPDGGYLLFGASTTIDGYNVAEGGCVAELPNQQHSRDGRCSELYRYDAVAGERREPAVVCVSCGPGDADAAGNAEFSRSATTEPTAAPVRAMSDDGDYVFFDSPAKLVQQADNETLDVYEWEAQGTGGCALAAGCVHLISSPNDAFPSYFLGSSPYYLPDGVKVEAGNVFIGTHASLVPQDTNSVGNIYDARICEPESPCIKPPPPPPLQCEGSTCQTPPTTPSDPQARLLPPLVASIPSTKVKVPVVLSAAEARAAHLVRALRVCRRVRVRVRRVACERVARRRFGPVKKKAAAKKAVAGRGVR